MGYSLLINYSLIHYFVKSAGCMELSFLVLRKIDKYYAGEVSSPLAKVEGGI